MNDSTFQREDRYIVIKRSDLKKVPVSYRSSLVDPMFSLLSHLPRRECLVIESDWPEYERYWQMIERRVAGQASEPETLATLVLGGAFDSTELGDNDIQVDQHLVEALQQRLVKSTDDVHIELVDRAVLDRVTAERDALQLRLNAADQRIDELTQGHGEQVALVPVERSYDVRAQMILAFNTSRQAGEDLDDALGAAYKAALRYTPHPGRAPARVASRDDSIAWLKRIDGIGQNRAELIYSMGFRRHTEPGE